jgi:D-serine deaminase-like pyridoxal phosphate-dependent protein
VNLNDLPTPCLVLDLGILKRNLAAMQAAVARHPGLVLRPHLKTAKSLDVAALAAPGFGPITVSTLAEARYFAEGGYRDQILAAGITPQKLHAVAALDAEVKVITDDAEAAAAIAQHKVQALVEVDVGEGRGGVPPESDELLAIARALGGTLRGVLSHSGHSYNGRTPEDMAAIAEQERAGITRAAQRLREAGLRCDIVSLGSSPTALYARRMDGVTDVRAGVYMFGDLFQAQLGTHGLGDIAMTVRASVIGRKPQRNAVLIDAGGLALSKDRSTANAPQDYGFGWVLEADGSPAFGGQALVARTHQEHGEVTAPAPLPFARLPIGARLRVAPNHTCMTAAAHPCDHVVDGGREVIAVWDRVNGW